MSEPALPIAAPLPAAELRWRCDPATLGFATTAEVEPIRGIIGQDEAIDALRFGLEIAAEGQNVYVRGLQGTGRLTTVRSLLEQIRPQIRPAPDRIYVYDFDHPDRPRLLTLERGQGKLFYEKLAELRSFIATELAPALDGEMVVTRRRELERRTLAEVEQLTKPLEGELGNAGLALVVREVGGVAQPVILPLIDGKPVPPERFAALIEQGKLSAQQLEELEQRSAGAREQVDRVFRRVGELQRQLRSAIRDMVRAEAERLFAQASAELREAFGANEGVTRFLDALVHDLVHRRLTEFDKIEHWLPFYEVNPISCHAVDDPPAVIVEYMPSMRALLGTVDAAMLPDGTTRADHLNIRAGALLRADGGVLVMEAADLLPNPGAWPALVRSLRSGRVEHVLPELPVLLPMPSLKPEPIPIEVKVVLLGDSALYHLLDQLDNDFPNLFKVLADFDEVIPRTPPSVSLYTGVFARIASDEGLPVFAATAIAELTEHGARVAGTRGKLTARLSRLADIAREAAYLTRKRERDVVEGEDVREAIRRTKRRAEGPARRFREWVADGRIHLATQGRVIGQINGLAVMQAGPLTYGFPTRITATIGTGVGGTINIERESQLSGAIHTKSFYILGGLLRNLLRTQHPLTFEASIAFEQSYGGIDGDSASGAEIVCLLSALTREPIRQDLAMTGAIDQLGNILPIGAVNEKIEGFFDTCKAQGSVGSQGVVIPAANVGDLMLRHDVVEACGRGEFHVWSVATIFDAIALFFDRPAGERDAETGAYPPDSVLDRAVAAAFMLWRQAQAEPSDFEVVAADVAAAEG